MPLGPLLMTLALMQPASRPEIVQQRSFQTAHGACRIEVPFKRNRTGEPNEQLVIRCGGKTILAHDLQDADVRDISISDKNGVLVSAHWERGSGSGLTVVEVSSVNSQSVARILFEYIAACGAESLENGTVILAHVGRRFVGSEVLPAATNVYRLRNGAYQFEAAYRWAADARWESRYCILSADAGCPATREAKVIKDTD